MSRRSRIAWTGLAVLALAPFAAEVAARTLEHGPAEPVGTAPGMFAPHAERGYALVPGWSDEARDLRVAPDGLRARSGIEAPAAPTTCVLTLGDGQTFGLGVTEHEAWPRVLEATLGLEGRAVEVVNAGVPGYHALQQAALLEELLSERRPDLVLWAIYVGNDVSATWSERTRPRHVHAGMLVEDDGRALLGLRTWLHRHSRAWRAWLEPGAGEPAANESELRERMQDQLAWDAGFALALAAIDPPEGVAEAWEAFDEALARVRKACEDAGTALEVVLIPAPLQYDAALWLEVHSRTRTDPGEYDLAQPTVELTARLEAAGLTVHALQDRLVEWSDAMTDPRSKPYLGYQLSVWGHRVVGQALARTLAAQGD